MNEPASVAPPPPPSGLRGWLGRLLHPVTPGMTPETPRVRVAALVIALGLIALQVIARYRWNMLPGKEWQAVHIVIGYAAVFAVIVAFHGPGVLRRVRRDTWFVLATAVVVLCVFWYFGRMDSWGAYWAEHVPDDGFFAPLYAFIYFSLCAFVLRLIVPFAAMRAFFGRRPGELGLRAATNPNMPVVNRVWIVYLLLFVGVFPFVLQVALENPAFQHKYPLARAIISPEGGIDAVHFLAYQAFYLLIFVSGESFWRGFLSFGTERDLGIYGLVLMVVPYVTAHFGKPLPETLGAIAAGMTLGFLALKHRSIWLGVALHYAVALSMDLLSVHANGFVIYWE